MYLCYFCVDNEAAQDLRAEKLASAGLDFFDESDKSNLY